MSESTEKIVLMKCTSCGHVERVPTWILEELNDFSNDKTYQMCCPVCDHKMLENDK